MLLPWCQDLLLFESMYILTSSHFVASNSWDVIDRGTNAVEIEDSCDMELAGGEAEDSIKRIGMKYS